MKYIKLYEDLIKDLSGLGLTEDRCQIVVTLERSKEISETPIILSFPNLNREGKITKEDVAEEMISGEYELIFDKLKGDLYRNRIKAEIDIFIRKESKLNKDRLIGQTLRFITGWYSLPVEAQLIIDGESIDSARNLSKNYWGK